MEITIIKVIVLLVLGLVKFLSGIAPLVFTKILERRSDRFLKKFIGSVLCFGGGVLLSTVMLHMWREVGESLEKASKLGVFPSKEKYPFTELIIGLGFLLILFIESAVHKFHGSILGMGSHTSQEKLTKKMAGERQIREKSVPTSEDPEECCETTDMCPAATKEMREKKVQQRVLSSLRSFLVVIALSVHSLFEGMAIGLEESKSGVWKLLLAVSIHAAPIVFCVSTDMISSGVKKLKVLIFMIILSINTPAGILIGLIVTSHLEQASGQHILIIGVLQGLAAGTLLYITFFEVLSRDKLDKYGMSGLLGALAIMLGFSLMAGLEITADHSHCGVGRISPANIKELEQ